MASNFSKHLSASIHDFWPYYPKPAVPTSATSVTLVMAEQAQRGNADIRQNGLCRPTRALKEPSPKKKMPN